ncbi:MAG: hypothetical protein QNJ54_33470 [Prochloraceae cyanobacterium]|nr:hypothetical protein [Prochloraceae cyanobacterium]
MSFYLSSDQGIDIITDFKRGENDIIQISKSGFGISNKDSITITQNTSSNDIFDLFVNGNQIATLQNVNNFGKQDIDLIA